MKEAKISLLIITIFLIIGLCGCTQKYSTKTQGSDESIRDVSNDDQDILDDTSYDTITIMGMDSSQTINKPNERVKIIITGMDNEITVTKNTILVEVVITGMDNILYVSKSHSFESSITGMNSLIEFYD